MNYIMHDRPWSEKEERPVITCPMVVDISAITIIYIQDAIDVYDADPCPRCMPRPDAIAYDIALEVK